MSITEIEVAPSVVISSIPPWLYPMPETDLFIYKEIFLKDLFYDVPCVCKEKEVFIPESEYFEVQMINLCVLQIYLCVMSRPMPMPNVIIDNIKLACV